MMRRAMLVVAVVLLAGSRVLAQAAPEPFEDVPPWHWAYDAVETARTHGLLVGYPPDPRFSAQNALIQSLEALAHPDHPAAQAWAERFLTDLPADWPHALRRSTLRAFRVLRIAVALQENRGTAEFDISFRLADGRTGIASGRVTVQRDATDRWRIRWSELARALPQVLR